MFYPPKTSTHHENPLKRFKAIHNYYFDRYGVLGLYITNKCNIKCTHCCVSSGPSETSLLEINKIISEIPKLVRTGRIKALHVSGGEPMLKQKEIQQIAKAGLIAKIPVAINTNGYWGSSKERATSLLNSIPGITQLIISTDEYHINFLPLESIKNAIEVALELGIIVHICICTTKGKRTKFVDILEEKLGNSILDSIAIAIVPVELGGRANNLPEANYRSKTKQYPIGKCSLINRPVVLEDGDVLACCNTTVSKTCKKSPLIMGNIKEETLESIFDRADKNLLLQAIRNLGPSFLAENLTYDQKKELKGVYLEGDICSICTDIMSKPKLCKEAMILVQRKDMRRIISSIDALFYG